MYTKLKLLSLDSKLEMGYWMYIRIALVLILLINIVKTILLYSAKLLNRLRNYRNLWENFTFGFNMFNINIINVNNHDNRKLNLKKQIEPEVLTNCEKNCSIGGENSFCKYRLHVIKIFRLIFLAILLSTFFVYVEPPRKQNVDSVQKHRQEKEKDFLDMIIWRTGMTMTGNVCEQTENRSYRLLAKSKRLQRKIRQHINQKEMKNVSVNTIAKMDPPSPKYSKCHAAETKKCLGSNPDDCSYLFYNFQNGRIFDGNFLIMVLVMEEENFDEVPRYIRIGNTRNFDRDSGNQRLAETQNPGDIVSTVDLNLHRRNSLRSLVESSGFNSLSLRYDDHDDSSGIGNASVQHSVLQNREFSMSFASGQPLRNTLSSGYQSGRRMHFSSGHHSFSLGSRISEINEEPNSNINHTSLNLEVNGIDISENNVLQQGALDLSNHQVSTNVISTGTRDFGGENIQSETSTITIHNTESKTRSDDHSDLSANTPSQCSRNTSLNPTPLMSSELQTPWQCPRNTNLNPAPLMNSELQTPWQCPRNTNLNPAPLMNSELQTPWQCPRNTNLNPAPLMNSELQTPWQCPRNTSFNPAPLMNSELQTPWQCPRTTNLSPAPLMNSELKTPWQCPRNTNLSPAPLMNSELQTPWQCPRNTSLNPAPLMNSELQTPWQCPRNTNLNPAPLMNSELQTPWQCPRNTSLNPAPLMNSELQTPWQCPRTTNLSPAPLMNSEKQTPWQCPRNTNLSPAPLMNSEKQTPWQCPRITILNPAPLMNSELQTPWQCPRNTNLSPAPLMNSELQTPWQCPRNTNLSPAPLMNSEKQTPWQCPRTTNLSPATLMNPEVHTPWQCPRNTSLNPVSPFEKNCVPSVESRSQQLAASVTSNKENIPADAPFAANIQTNEPEIQLNLNGAQFNSHRQFIRRNDIMGENPDYANEDKFVLPDIDDIDEDHIFGDGSTDSQELNDHVGTEEDDENQREEDSCSYDSENQNPGKDPDYEI